VTWTELNERNEEPGKWRLGVGADDFDDNNWCVVSKSSGFWVRAYVCLSSVAIGDVGYRVNGNKGCGERCAWLAFVQFWAAELFIV
jgi:hypothetical protein